MPVPKKSSRSMGFELFSYVNTFFVPICMAAVHVNEKLVFIADANIFTPLTLLAPVNIIPIRLSSDAVLHMSRIECK